MLDCIPFVSVVMLVVLIKFERHRSLCNFLDFSPKASRN